MDKQDYYATLGVERNADADTIKKAYRRKAMKIPPDKTQAMLKQKKFKLINEAQYSR